MNNCSISSMSGRQTVNKLLGSLMVTMPTKVGIVTQLSEVQHPKSRLRYPITYSCTWLAASSSVESSGCLILLCALDLPLFRLADSPMLCCIRLHRLANPTKLTWRNSSKHAILCVRFGCIA